MHENCRYSVQFYISCLPLRFTFGIVFLAVTNFVPFLFTRIKSKFMYDIMCVYCRTPDLLMIEEVRRGHKNR